ncbi:MAG: hypothetical protein KME08_02070 [Aphanothece sp. CMT-3BRIN-NPC111]|nr:hypothetical protein [Aphanothece sp. CMT-3BRIN-NPC111]
MTRLFSSGAAKLIFRMLMQAFDLMFFKLESNRGELGEAILLRRRCAMVEDPPSAIAT